MLCFQQCNMFLFSFNVCNTIVRKQIKEQFLARTEYFANKCKCLDKGCNTFVKACNVLRGSISFARESKFIRTMLFFEHVLWENTKFLGKCNSFCKRMQMICKIMQRFLGKTHYFSESFGGNLHIFARKRKMFHDTLFLCETDYICETV